MNQNDQHDSESEVEQVAGIGCIVVPAVLFVAFVIWRITSVGLATTLKGISDFIVGVFNFFWVFLGDSNFWKGPLGWAVGGFLFLMVSALMIGIVKAVSTIVFPRLVDSYTQTYLARGFKMEEAARKADSSAQVYLLLTYCVLIVIAAIWLLILLKILF